MAEHIVKPIGWETILLKCSRCKTLYEPDPEFESRFYTFEECPVCKYEHNDWSNVIPLWKYNLIRYFRRKFR